MTRNYTFGRAVGINSGNTGTLTSAACTGPCGPTTPVDVVLIIDRTLSMQNSGSIPNLKTAADAVLEAYDPAFQRIALAMLGPTTLNQTCAGTGGPAPPQLQRQRRQGGRASGRVGSALRSGPHLHCHDPRRQD